MNFVFDIKPIEMEDNTPDQHFTNILNDENDNTIEPNPKCNKLAGIVCQAADRDIVEGGARPEESKASRGSKSDGRTYEEDVVRQSSKEKLVGRTRGKESEDVSDGNFEKNAINDLTISETAYTPNLKKAVRGP